MAADIERLVRLVETAMDQVDDSLSYDDLALATALILREHYGDHNYGPFIASLQKYLKNSDSDL